MIVARVCFCVVLTTSSQFVVADQSHYEQVLSNRGIRPDVNGIIAYLQKLHPTENELEQARKLIKQLGDHDFDVRETAMRQLLIMPVLPGDELQAAWRNPDPEIRWRVRKVLQRGTPETSFLLYAAFKVIAKQKLSPAVPELLNAIPLCTKRHLQAEAARAIEACALPEHAETLRTALQSEHAGLRAAAVTGLATAL
jgi:HEAT repeat protein